MMAHWSIVGHAAVIGVVLKVLPMAGACISIVDLMVLSIHIKLPAFHFDVLKTKERHSLLSTNDEHPSKLSG